MTKEDQEIVDLLKQDIDEKINIIQKNTERKTTVDSITHTIPSSTLNTSIVNNIESNHLEQYRINRRIN